MQTDVRTSVITARWIVLSMRNASDKSCTENKTRIYSSITPPPKVVAFVRKCGKILYSRTGQRWQIIRRMRFAYWILKAKITHRICNIYGFFHCNSGCTNGPQNYVKRTLPALWNYVKRTLPALWNYVKSTLPALWNYVKRTLPALWNYVKRTLPALWNYSATRA